MGVQLDMYVIVEKSEAGIAVCGFGNRHLVHSKPLRHLTVQVLPIAWEHSLGGAVLLTSRRSSQMDRERQKWDFCGGHVTFHDLFHQGYDWSGASLLHQISTYAAFREAREEIRNASFRKEDLTRFRSIGEFWWDGHESENSWNLEYSTAFVLRLEDANAVEIWESTLAGEEKLQKRALTLTELLADFRKHPEAYADGATRILTRLEQDSVMVDELTSIVDRVTQPPHGDSKAAITGPAPVPFGSGSEAFKRGWVNGFYSRSSRDQRGGLDEILRFGTGTDSDSAYLAGFRAGLSAHDEPSPVPPPRKHPDDTEK